MGLFSRGMADLRRPKLQPLIQWVYSPHPRVLLPIISILVGSEPIDRLAEHIWRSVGPSGKNKVRYLPRALLPSVLIDRKDYLYELTAAVRKLSPESHDSHLYALEVSF